MILRWVENMRGFLFNLVLISGIVIALFFVMPDIMKQVVGVYNGMGILGIFIAMIVVAAIPGKSRGRRR
jgi:hypothetical protein